MRYDLHTHTLFSDGRDSVWEMARAADAAGLDALALTDHLEADRFGTPMTDWVDAFLREVEAARGKVKVRLLAGVEAALLNVQGAVTVTPEVYRKVDIVLCGIEWGTRGIALNPPDNPVAFQRVLVTAYGNLALNPFVDVIAHPFNLGRFPLKLPLNQLATSAIREIAAAFSEGDKAFDLNNTLWWWFPDTTPQQVLRHYARIVEEFADAGVKFVCGSDAHSLHGVGNLTWVAQLIRLVGLTEEHFLTLEQLRERRLRRLL
ncbi:DNA polymerase/3'-5' exonuclease PolX [bacterium HR17]|uniref:DNA polymerase/3'-5' exonuclease PolX n=1 Tax=Candidatus Fervidibacter japonicus TaxID=2035412 RepID=A0A2H5X9X7_9BACT|nr:DNA polymerase/3'-5' exonuclease PolX [bacterium HR17]